MFASIIDSNGYIHFVELFYQLPKRFNREYVRVQLDRHSIRGIVYCQQLFANG